MQSIQTVKTCILCGSGNLSIVEVEFAGESGVELVPVCQQCGHYHFKETKYAYLVTGIAHKWASGEDLKGVIEDILKHYLPANDVENMKVQVQELG